MRTTVLIAGLVAAAATAADPIAHAQTSLPGSAGGAVSPFADNLAGRLVGFGDRPAVSGPAGSGGAVGGPLAGLPLGTNPFSANTFRPAGLFLAPGAPTPPGIGVAATATATTAGGPDAGSGAGALPTTTRARATAVFAGGVGPRRFGLR